MSKLNIAEVLTAIDGNIKEYYDALEPEQQKEISPWVLMITSSLSTPILASSAWVNSACQSASLLPRVPIFNMRQRS